MEEKHYSLCNSKVYDNKKLQFPQNKEKCIFHLEHAPTLFQDENNVNEFTIRLIDLIYNQVKSKLIENISFYLSKSDTKISDFMMTNFNVKLVNENTFNIKSYLFSNDEILKEIFLYYFNKEKSIDTIINDSIVLTLNIEIIKLEGINFQNNIDFWQISYLMVLNKCKKLFFNKCKFYTYDLYIKESQCFFNDCEFFIFNLTDYATLKSNENINNVIFKECKFSSLSCNNLTIESKLFDNCDIDEFQAFFSTFKKPLNISAKKITINFSTLETDFLFNLENTNKEIDNLVFDNCEINGKFICLNTILKKSSFYNTNFNHFTDFSNSTFYSNNNKEQEIFERSNFYDLVVFSHAIFIENIKFKYSNFEKNVIFRDASFNQKIDLRDSNFKDQSSFLDIDVNELNRETARIIKNSFEQQNNIIEANKFYALEMKEMEKELKFYKKPFEWLVFKIHGLASNHSQEWLLALFWIINLTFITTYLSYELLDEGIVKHLDRGITFFGGLVALGVVLSKFNEFYRNIGILISTICIYLFYSDRYIDNKNLKEFSNMLNPFSIMTKGEELTFGILIYKIILAYLIYQLIISIRQNTRRK